MLRVLGGPKRFCDGLTRRELLQVGSLGLLGLGLSDSSATTVKAGESRPSASLPGFGRAKSCILLFMYGSPSQLETFDPKPDAPAGDSRRAGLHPVERPGPERLRAAPSTVAGDGQGHAHPIGLASLSDPWSCVRDHGDSQDRRRRWRSTRGTRTTGRSSARPSIISTGISPGAPRSPLPRNLVLPWAFSSQRVGEVPALGPYGGFLGRAYDPSAPSSSARGRRSHARRWPATIWEDLEPYRGITPESRLQLGSVSNLGPELTLDRLDRRRTLLEQIEHLRREADASASRSSGIDRHRAMAYDLLGSESLRRAFDLGQEPAETRDLYGMTLFGQASLTARRLVEAGGRFITVFWDEFGLAGTGWDTHWDHFPRMKDELLPGLDRTLSGLLVDLDRRGQLDETLVVLPVRAWPDSQADHGPRAAVATTGRGATRSSWPAAAWRAGPSWGDPTRSPATRPSVGSRPRTSWPRSTICWALTQA